MSCFVEYKAFLNIHFLGMDLLPVLLLLLAGTFRQKLNNRITLSRQQDCIFKACYLSYQPMKKKNQQVHTCELVIRVSAALLERIYLNVVWHLFSLWEYLCSVSSFFAIKKRAGYTAALWGLNILRLPGSCCLISRFLTSLNLTPLFIIIQLKVQGNSLVFARFLEFLLFIHHCTNAP